MAVMWRGWQDAAIEEVELGDELLVARPDDEEPPRERPSFSRARRRR